MRTRVQFGPASQVSYRWYVICAVLLSLSGFVYGTSRHGLFSCQPSKSGKEQFTSYCHATAYGDYDHGAFWFNLEADAVKNAKSARVLFLGNSRMEIGMSTKVVDDWFAGLSKTYYLLGFTHGENQMFAEPLLERLGPEAEIYIINVDGFFEQELKGPADDVINNPMSRNRYEQKRTWQTAHRFICGRLSALCGNEVTYIRSIDNGSMQLTGESSPPEGGVARPLLSDDLTIDDEIVEAGLVAARSFLENLPRRPRCLILTNVPNADTSAGTARELASALDLPLIAPHVDNLATVDGSHLDPDSAIRWSASFVEGLEPVLAHCMAGAAR